MNKSNPSLVKLTAKIMIVSDFPSSIAVWTFSLQQTGMSICLAPLSNEAIKIWTEEHPDVIVIDSYAWKHEDIEICRVLRGLTDVPILLFPANTADYYQLEAYNAGVDDVVSSPISPRLFAAKVHAWLRHVELESKIGIDVIQIGEFQLDTNNRLLRRGEEVLYHLSINETSLLYQLMSHPNRLLETPVLIESIWGLKNADYKIRLKHLVYHLRQKIELDPANPINLLTEGNLGYRFFPGVTFV